MSGTYPSSGYGGPPGYDRQPGYGGQPEYDNDRGYDGGAYPGYGQQQPGYGQQQPGYGQPGYGGGVYGGGAQPGYSPPIPAQGYPGHDSDPYANDYRDYRGYQDDRYAGGPDPSLPAPTAPKRRRRGRTAVIVLSVLGVLLLVCGIGGYAMARPYLAEWPATLAKPDKLAGLEISSEPALQQAANEIAAGIRKDVQVDEAMAAFYHDPKTPEKIVAIVGGTAFLMNPKAELDEAFKSAGSEGMAITNVQDVDSGPLGGLTRCGSAEQVSDGGDKIPLSICAWADHGSLVIGLFFHRSVEDSASLLRQIRSEILTR